MERVRSKLAEVRWREFVDAARLRGLDLGGVCWVGPPESDAVRAPFSPRFPEVVVVDDVVVIADGSEFDREVVRRLAAVDVGGVAWCFLGDDLLGAFEVELGVLLKAPDLVRRCLELDGDTFYVVLEDQTALACDITEHRAEGRFEIARGLPG